MGVLPVSILAGKVQNHNVSQSTGGRFALFLCESVRIKNVAKVFNQNHVLESDMGLATPD